MQLILELTEKEVGLKLLKNRTTIDLGKSLYYHDLSRVLITTVDNLLKGARLDPIRLFANNKAGSSTKAKSNGINLKSIKSYKISSNLGQDSTSYKIASSFIKALETQV